MTFKDLEIGDRFWFPNGSILRIKTSRTMCRWDSSVIHKERCKPDVKVRKAKNQMATGYSEEKQ